MFEKIYIEKEVKDNAYTLHILERFKKFPVHYIDKVENYWGRVKKPYLQKRTNLNLFIGKKEGELVKEAPDAYGLGNEKHYYFVHAYNCIYECQYCYLQGYFHTPDIVLFVNHDEIINKMQEIVDKDPKQNPWFHAGEYSDSLALSHITNEWNAYWEFFHKNPKSKLELRTKSVNIRSLKEMRPLDNIYVSFTLAPTQEAKEYDLKCPSTKARLNAIKELTNRGFNIGIHFDPIIYNDKTFDHYRELVHLLMENTPEEKVGYISIGVVRFTKDVYREVQKNYSESNLLKGEFIKSFDGKVRYNHPTRMWILNNIKKICLEANIQEHKIYMCMEEE